MQKKLLEISDAILAGGLLNRKLIQIPGFAILLDENDPLVWLSYAIPIDDHCRRPQSIRRLLTTFSENHRVPRLDYFSDLWPGLDLDLLGQGFELQAIQPVLTIEEVPTNLRLNKNLKAWLVNDVSDIRCGVEVARRAFGSPPAAETELMRTTNLVQLGAMTMAVCSDGSRIIASGWSLGTSAICELAGIGTDPNYRRIGAATAVTASLLDHHFGRFGRLAWLTAGDDISRACYERLGFKPLGCQQNWWHQKARSY